jgi:hypothetical protein
MKTSYFTVTLFLDRTTQAQSPLGRKRASKAGLRFKIEVIIAEAPSPIGRMIAWFGTGYATPSCDAQGKAAG